MGKGEGEGGRVGGERERRKNVPFMSQQTVEMEIRNMFLTNLRDEEEFTSCFDFCADFISLLENFFGEVRKRSCWRRV